jgi:hypothetical protein
MFALLIWFRRCVHRIHSCTRLRERWRVAKLQGRHSVAARRLPPLIPMEITLVTATFGAHEENTAVKTLARGYVVVRSRLASSSRAPIPEIIDDCYRSS